MDKQLRNKKRDVYINGNPKVRYPDFFLIPFLSLGIGYMMVQLGANTTWLSWESDPKVRMSIFSSIGCTTVVLLTLATLNRQLDSRFPWRTQLAMRIGAQYVACVLLPSLLVAGWQFFFFRYIGAPERIHGYMDEDFPAVHWMLAVWNLFYLGVYLYAVPSNWRPNEETPDATNEPEVKKPAAMRKRSGSYNDQDLVYWKKNVAIFMSENKKISAVLATGKKREYKEPAKFFHDLVGDQFYMVRSGKLVNRDYIDKVYDDGRFYTILLKEPNHRLRIATKMDGKAAFNAWWGGKIALRSEHA